jgi:hypothetical protein
VRDDGVRAGLDWEEVIRIDGMVKLLLELFGIPYIPVESLPMQERVRLLERVLNLAGVRRSESAPTPATPVCADDTIFVDAARRI